MFIAHLRESQRGPSSGATHFLSYLRFKDVLQEDLSECMQASSSDLVIALFTKPPPTEGDAGALMKSEAYMGLVVLLSVPTPASLQVQRKESCLRQQYRRSSRLSLLSSCPPSVRPWCSTYAASSPTLSSQRMFFRCKWSLNSCVAPV